MNGNGDHESDFEGHGRFNTDIHDLDCPCESCELERAEDAAIEAERRKEESEDAA